MKRNFFVLADEGVKASDEDLKFWQEAFFESLDDNAKSLYDSWTSFPENFSQKSSTYFQGYAELLSRFRGKNCTLVEIGVFEGGSLKMWKDWLGPKSRIIGIDLNPEATKYQEKGIEIVIGDQADPDFWQQLFVQYPEIDIVIDDGGHQYFQQIITFFSVAFNTKKSVCLIFEDVTTSYYTDFIKNNEGKSFIEFSKTLLDNLMAKQKFSKRNRLKWIENIDESKLKGYNFVQSIHYHSGIFALNINRKNNLIPLTLSDTPVSKKSQDKDYRFASGVKGVSFIWPDPFDKKTVTVKANKFDDTPEKAIIKIKFN